jgi:hypothetical protein
MGMVNGGARRCATMGPARDCATETPRFSQVQGPPRRTSRKKAISGAPI